MFGFCVEGNANFRVGVGGNANFSIFRYQHVGIGNAKSSRWGTNPMQGPDASGSLPQWNIGLKLSCIFTQMLYIKHKSY